MSFLWDAFDNLRRRAAVFLIRIVFNLVHIFAVRRDQQLAANAYGASVETVHIPSSDPTDRTRTIKAHLYTPPSGPASPASPKPVLVNWHGSGWTIPFHGSDVAFSARVAKELDAYVIDADYRKAPENPFPAALDDVKNVLDWVATHPERFDASRVAVSGASAGGSLALIAASTLRKSLKVDIKAVFAHYPVTDLSLQAEDRVIRNPVDPLPPPVLELFYSNYISDVAMRKDPRVSPMYAKVEDYAPTVVIVACGGDTLSVEAKRLAERLDDGNRKVVKCVLEGMNHGYDIGARPGTKEWHSREEAHALAMDAFKESFGTR
ncbi:alpha/beta-hydrolase [Bimuria novae-zelandiae CBS 107.79]|uniref:Alpha/beta-hydrolase n=1 Tax=Bimuria novae-zelandiae CBS 107.79 TaxID=1447943 RepID=A0A6A5VEE6_9PLEO|nr:alpha/beta-hydrolase [Bimuria novae-zelandiae CBS 107.79]